MRALVGTRKGLFRLALHRDGWRIEGPWFLGVRVMNAWRDPRDGVTWALLGHGHFGPKLFAARDGEGFERRPCPAFLDGTASVDALCTIAGADDALHIGTAPGALFTSRDGGGTWNLNEALWQQRADDGWAPSGGGIMLHSIAAGGAGRMHIAVSCGGVYETGDGGATWAPRNRGVKADFLPDPYPDTGQDPHRLLGAGDALWQQNRCGTYRSDDGGRTWTEVRAGFGFALAVDGRSAWTIPVDSDEQRVAPDGALTVCRTDDGGATWRDLSAGLPREHCYDIVYRHALDVLEDTVLFGTTTGRVYASGDRGDAWTLAAPHLPPVSSVAFER